MSIDITIKQKLFGNKTIPLDVILGESLCYGRFENDHLIPGELGDGEFIAYCPDAIGRGFSVVWNPREKKRIELRLPQPSTAHELKLLYAAVERICRYWQGKLTVDGNAVSLPSFLDGLDDMVAFNDRWLQQLCWQILNGESDSWTLFSALFPVDMGREEAERFSADPKAYGDWLHEKQSVEARFGAPAFYNTENGITGVFFITSDIPYLLPKTPDVPFGMMDPITRKPLQCSLWRVAIMLENGSEPVADMAYDAFVEHIPREMRKKFDNKRFLSPSFSQKELETLAESCKM